MDSFSGGIENYNKTYLETLERINKEFSKKLDSIVDAENSPSIALKKLNDVITQKAEEISKVVIGGGVGEGTSGGI